MASAEVPIVIGEEFVEAAKQAVEKATAPFRGVGEYRIGSDGDNGGDGWPYVEHLPCEQDIWSGQEFGGAGLNVAELLKLIAAHQCPKGDDRG